MKNVNKKYRDIVDAGKKLFWKHGIKRVTVEDICKKAEVSRVTFYKYFNDKENLALFILRTHVEGGMEKYTRIMNDHVSFEEKIRRIIELKIESSDELSPELLKDLKGGDFPELHNYFEQYTHEGIETFMNDLRKAQWEGYIRKDLKTEFILVMLNKLIDMTTDESLEKMYPSTSQLLGEMTRFFFYGVMPEGD